MPILHAQGHDAVDLGTSNEESVDYPVFAEKAARAVAGGEADRAIIVCGSGVGVSITANKVNGVRAVNAHDSDEAELSRRHNDANVLCLAGRKLTPAQAERITEAFLNTDFEGGRHQRRVDLISALEAE